MNEQIAEYLADQAEGARLLRVAGAGPDRLRVIEVDPAKKYIFACSARLSEGEMKRLNESLDRWLQGDKRFVLIEAIEADVFELPMVEKGEGR